MAKLKALKNHIVFQFVDAVTANGQFLEQATHAGIILRANFDDSAKQPRWARIVSLGPLCDDVLRVDGCEVLIENLKWTPHVKFEGQKYWRTDETQVLGYRYPEDSTKE